MTNEQYKLYLNEFMFKNPSADEMFYIDYHIGVIQKVLQETIKTADFGVGEYLDGKELIEGNLIITKTGTASDYFYFKEELDFLQKKKELLLNTPIDQIAREAFKSPQPAKESYIPKKLPEKWHALHYWFELTAHGKEVLRDLDGSFIKSELETEGKKRCKSTGQSFYRSFKDIDINNTKMLEREFGKSWKERILELSKNDTIIIEYINNKYTGV